MDSKKIIRQLMLERELSLPELAEKLGYSLNDFMKILDALDCDLKVVTRDTQKEFF